MLASLQRRLIYRPTRETVVLPEKAGISPEAVTLVGIRTHDNLVLNGWHVACRPHNSLWLPDGPREPARGLMIYFPGNARNRQYRGVNCLTLAELGVDVLLVDYRGYAENAGSPREEHIAADARAICKYAVENLRMPLSKIVLHGESLGGAVATRVASELSQAGTPAAGLVLGSTFSSLAEAGSRLFPWLPVRWVLVEKYLSIERIANVASPLLVLHGRDDDIVPIDLGRKLFDAAPARSHCGREKRFVELAANHNDVYYVARDEFREAVRVFLDEIWKAQPAIPPRQNDRKLQLENSPY